MTVTEVVVLLEGHEVRQCDECFAPMASVWTRYHRNGDYYYERHVIECEKGHARMIISPMKALTDEMRDLLE